MASLTGIELKPDSCVLAGVRSSRTGIDVFALQVIGPSDWPGQDLAVAEALRAVRTAKRLPRRARVVVWGMPDHGSADDPSTLALLRPLTTAGFRIESVSTPPTALAVLAAHRPRQASGAAVAWLALNMHGAAIAIVRGPELLYSRTFDWLYTPGVAGSTAQLLQRYTLVAHLAPELRHGIAQVRASHGVAVDAAVTCGDLPDLRSLTMPLIEELDLEVETLDSTHGLRAIGRAGHERFAELAPALRLASATSLIRVGPAGTSRPGRRWMPAAAVAALVAGGAGYVYWSAPDPNLPRFATTLPAASSTQRPADSQRAPSTLASSPVPAAAVAPAMPAGTPQPPASRPSSASPDSSESRVGPGGSVPRAAVPVPTMVGSRPSAGPSAVPPMASTTPAVRPSVPPQAAAAPSAKPAPEQQTRPAADKPMARASPAFESPPAVRSAQVPASRMPPASPLSEPLPRVDSILIDRDRRLAIIDGAILEVGDAVGLRTVAQIDRLSVMLREASGLEIRVPLRPSGVR